MKVSLEMSLAERPKTDTDKESFHGISWGEESRESSSLETPVDHGLLKSSKS